ncbi:tyrosine-protein phosphatase [Aquiflexum sp.]|uniref:tyrosine-protein phosphatase n=1 Tax=Aquiflexum sp. TaxID=1872584 RepID=UPI0035935CCE
MGVLDIFNFIIKDKPIQDLDLSWMGADMHSHLIPGIDDGSKSMEESIAMIKRLKGYGLQKIITTPHVMSEYYKNSPETILPGLAKLREALLDENIEIQIEAAAEYFIDEMLMEKLKNGEKLLPIGDNLVLVETGFMSRPLMLKEIFFDMEMHGYKPVLAHPERYQYLIQDKDFLYELIDRDVYFQINLLSLTGFYSKPIKNFAELLIDEGKIRFFGTDCHNHRYLDMLETLPKYKYFEKIQEMSLLNNSL